MGDLLNTLQNTPLPNILVVGGIVLLILGIVSKFGGKVNVYRDRRNWALIIGAFLVIMGIFLYLISPSHQPTPVSTAVGAEPPKVLPTGLFTPIQVANVTPGVSSTIPQSATVSQVSPTEAPRTPTLTSTPSPTETRTRTPTLNPTPVPMALCPGALPHLVHLGDKVWVATKVEPLKVHYDPGYASPVFQLLPPGAILIITEGPACANDRWWWKVRTPSGLLGWVVEGSDDKDEHFILPYQ